MYEKEKKIKLIEKIADMLLATIPQKLDLQIEFRNGEIVIRFGEKS